MRTRSIAVRRTARFHLLGDPEAVWDELWFVLHGYGQLAARFLAEFEARARPGRLIVAPEGLSRFYLRGTRGRVGASWMTRDAREDEIADYLAYLDAVRAELTEARTVPWREGLLGFSQGTATAGRWALLGARAPERLVLWGGGFPPDAAAMAGPEARARLTAMRVTLVAGEADEHTPRAAVEQGRVELEGLGARVDVAWHGGAHHLDGALLERLLEG